MKLLLLNLAQFNNPFPEIESNQSSVETILSMVFGIVGALSFLFVVIGGFRYVISRGDPQSIAKAKHTIMYALIGLVVAITATAIVNFTVGRIE